MATQIGNAYLQIIPSAKGIQKTIASELNTGAGNAGTQAGESIASKLKGAIVGAGIGAAIGSTIKQAIGEGAALEQSIGGIEAIFGDAADKVKAYAQESWASVGVSANSYMEGVTSFSAALIRDMGGDTEKAAEIANQAFVDMGDNANRFGKSVEEVQTVYQGLAKGQFQLLDNLNLGFAGSKQGMKDLLAYASELSGQEYSIDSLADMYQAIHVVQEELNVTGTTAREATTTISGSLGALKASWADLLGNMAIGEDISAPLTNLSTSISTFLGNLIPMIGQVVAQLPSAIFTLVSTLAPQLLQSGTEIMQQIGVGLGHSVPQLVQSGMTALTSFSANLRANFGRFVDAGLELIKHLVQGVVNSIPTFVSMAPEIISNFAGLINDNAPKVVEAGKGILKNLWEGIKSLVSSVKENWREIADALLDVWEAINWINLGKDVINFIWGGIKNIAPKIPEFLKSVGSKAWEWFKNVDWLGLGKSVITFVVNGLGSLVSSIPSKLKSIGQSALSAFKNINWLQLGKDIVNGIISGIANMAGSLFGSLRDLASNALKSAKNFLGIGSPSKVFAAEVGRWIPEGIAMGVDKYADVATGAIDEMTNDFIGGVNPSVSLSATAAGQLAPGGVGTQGGNVINIYSNVTGAEDPEEYGRKLVAAAMLELRAQ